MRQGRIPTMTNNPRRTTWNGPTGAARPALETMLYGLTLVGLVMALAVAAQAQDSPLGRGVRLHQDLPLSTSRPDGQPVGGDGLHHYGILGPVGQADVYSSDDPRLTLAELVAGAGGLTDDAAPLAKVIRHGRGGLELIYSPTSSDQLMSGDLVVFDRATADPGQPGGSNRFFPSNSPADDLIGVAFVGIQPLRPVVISLPTSFATVPQVIDVLNQPPELINTVQILRTSPSGAANRSRTTTDRSDGRRRGRLSADDDRPCCAGGSHAVSAGDTDRPVAAVGDGIGAATDAPSSNLRDRCRRRSPK